MNERRSTPTYFFAHYPRAQRTITVRREGLVNRLTCPICRTYFTAMRNDAVHCSASCRAKALRNRREDKHRRMVDLLRDMSMILPDGDPSLYSALAREARRIANEPY